MAKLRTPIVFMLTCLCLSLLVGRGGASGNLASSNILEGIMQAWRAGNNAALMRELHQFNWGDPSVINGVSVSKITEQEFEALEAAEKTRSKSEALDLALAAISLQHHAFALAEQKEIVGERLAAQEYYQGVQQLGKTLAHPDRLEVLRIAGNVLLKKASDKMTAVDKLSHIAQPTKRFDSKLPSD